MSGVGDQPETGALPRPPGLRGRIAATRWRRWVAGHRPLDPAYCFPVGILGTPAWVPGWVPLWR